MRMQHKVSLRRLECVHLSKYNCPISMTSIMQALKLLQPSLWLQWGAAAEPESPEPKLPHFPLPIPEMENVEGDEQILHSNPIPNLDCQVKFYAIIDEHRLLGAAISSTPLCQTWSSLFLFLIRPTSYHRLFTISFSFISANFLQDAHNTNNPNVYTFFQ